MKQIKKIVISILVGIIAIFGLGVAVNAYGIGENLALTYGTYVSNDDIYCVEHRTSIKRHLLL